MNLDTLRDGWAEQNRKLDRMVRLNVTAVREMQFAKTKSSLQWLGRGIMVELVMNIIAIVWLGNFMAEHVREPRFLIPALVIEICAIALASVCGRQLVALRQLDFGGPVVAVQRELEKLRILRIRATKWTVVLSFVLWAPILVVMAEGLLGVDAYMVVAEVSQTAGNFFRWIVWNVIFGVAAALLVIWVSRRYADRFNKSPFFRSLMDDIAGRSLTRALQSLDSIERFEDTVESVG